MTADTGSRCKRVVSQSSVAGLLARLPPALQQFPELVHPLAVVFKPFSHLAECLLGFPDGGVRRDDPLARVADQPPDMR